MSKRKWGKRVGRSGLREQATGLYGLSPQTVSGICGLRGGQDPVQGISNHSRGTHKC